LQKTEMEEKYALRIDSFIPLKIRATFEMKDIDIANCMNQNVEQEDHEITDYTGWLTE